MKARTGIRSGELAPVTRPTEDDGRAFAAFMGLGFAALAFYCGEPELAKLAIRATRNATRRPPAAPPAVDLAAKYPNAIEVK